MRKILDRCLDAVPVYGTWRRAARKLPLIQRAVGPFAPGHFYSPIPSGEDVEQAIDDAGRPPRDADGIDLRVDAQRDLLRKLARYYGEQPFTEQPVPTCRMHLANDMYCYADALLLHCMMRHLQPRRIVEVGSGYSSAVMLETNQRFLGGKTQLTFVEPYPQRLQGLMRPEDRERCELIAAPVQQVPLERFAALEPGDILFIDSSHVGKAHSDVLFLLFHVLPRLRPGVFVHVHDIFPYFEYPASWLREGRYWNEAYLMRAFLQWNRRFRIALWGPWLLGHDLEWVRQHMPLCAKNVGGSLWLSIHDV